MCVAGCCLPRASHPCLLVPERCPHHCTASAFPLSHLHSSPPPEHFVKLGHRQSWAVEHMQHMYEVMGFSTPHPKQYQTDQRRRVTLSTTEAFQRVGHRAPEPTARPQTGAWRMQQPSQDTGQSQASASSDGPQAHPPALLSVPSHPWGSQVPACPSLDMVVSRHASWSPGEGGLTRMTHSINQITLSFQPGTVGSLSTPALRRQDD